MSAAQNPQSTSQPQSAVGFVEPQNLQQFNAFIVNNRVSEALTPSEFLLLKEKVTRVDLARSLIAIHGGGMNREKATHWLRGWFNKIRALVASGHRAEADNPAQTGSTPFVEPNTLRAINEFFGTHNLSLQLTQPELDSLLRNTGRVALMTALKGTHDNGDGREKAIETLKAAVHDAKVRVARGETPAHSRTAAEELPPDTGSDGGYEGMPAASTREPPRGQFSGQRSGQSRRDNPPPTNHNAHSPDHERVEYLPSGNERPDREEGSPKKGPQARAYGSKAALCMEAIVSRQGEATLRVEMAPAKPNVQKMYEWKTKKIVFDMMRRELLEFLAVLHGWAPGAKFQYHGPTKAKWFQCVNQGAKIYISMGDKDAPLLGIPVAEVDTLMDMVALAIKQACLTYHDIPSGDLLRYVQLRVAPHITPVPART